MEITKEESEAYRWAVQCGGTWDFPSVLRDALRRHVAAAMRLEFLLELSQPISQNDLRLRFTADDWDRAAHEALMNGS